MDAAIQSQVVKPGSYARQLSQSVQLDSKNQVAASFAVCLPYNREAQITHNAQPEGENRGSQRPYRPHKLEAKRNR